MTLLILIVIIIGVAAGVWFLAKRSFSRRETKPKGSSLPMVMPSSPPFVPPASKPPAFPPSPPTAPQQFSPPRPPFSSSL